MSERITLDVDGHVFLMGVNRPEKRNAFDLAALEQLAEGYRRLAEDDRLRVGLLYAHGDHFSAGLDWAEVGPAVKDRRPRALAGGGRYDPFGIWGEPVPKPIVMAVQGIAYTLSIELALASDIVVAAEDVQFRQLEVGRGFPPFGGASFRAPAALGWGNAMRFLLTAEAFGADTASRIGLVQEVAPVGRHLDRAADIARHVAEQAPLAVRATLANARVGRAKGESSAAFHMREVLPDILASEDAEEGLHSFIERRKGDFIGR